MRVHGPMCVCIGVSGLGLGTAWEELGEGLRRATRASIALGMQRNAGLQVPSCKLQGVRSPSYVADPEPDRSYDTCAIG